MGERKHIYGKGISTGIAVGLIFGLMLDNLALGFVLGISVGSLFDYYSSRKKEGER